MSDLRGGSAQDRTGFYGSDTTALPLMQGPEDMPETPALEALGAGWRVAQDDWLGQSRQRLNDAYGPLVEAVRAETGRSINRYVWVGHSSGGVNYERVWQDIAEIRARKPDFLKDAGTDQGDFEKRLTERTRARRGQDLAAIERADGVAGAAALGGQFAGAMADPVNLSTLPFGGFGRTVAQRVLTEGLANAAVEAIEQPMIAAERAERGETLGAGEAAANVAGAAVLGAAVQGALVEPLTALARKRLGWGRLTDTERAAVHVLEREAEIDATSPFAPGAGSEAHAERLEATMAAILAEQPPASARARMLAGTSLGGSPVPRETSAGSASVSRGTPAFAGASPPPRAQVKALIRQAESGGNDAAANGRSTAYGRYQFTAGTWLRYYRRRYGMQGLSEEAVLAKRADPAMQEQLMDDLTADNAAALARIGVPETPGSLYLMHFLGQGGGTAVLRADRATPIERVVGEGVVNANPFLRGKSAGDVIEWADRRMGAPGATGPVVRRDLFPDNAEGDRLWREAQAASDVADVELRQLRRERDGVDAPEPEIALGRDLEAAPVATREAGDAPVGMDWEPAARPIEDRTIPARQPIDPARDAEVRQEEAMAALMFDIGAEARAAYPELPLRRQEFARGYMAALGDPASIDRLTGVEAEEAGAAVARANWVDLSAIADDPRYRSEYDDEGALPATSNVDAPAAGASPVEYRVIDTASGDEVVFSNASADAAIKRRDRLNAEVDHPEGKPRYLVAQADARAITEAQAEAALSRFDDPASKAAEDQIASIEHDLRQLAQPVEGRPPVQLSFRLGDEGDERGLADVLAEWDADAAAIEAIRGCL